MDTKKLDKWAELLLDTSKRNNLMNFRDAKATTVEVVYPAPDELFGRMEGSADFEVYDPRIAEDEDEDENAAEEGCWRWNPVRKLRRRRRKPPIRGSSGWQNIPGRSGGRIRSCCTILPPRIRSRL